LRSFVLALVIITGCCLSGQWTAKTAWMATPPNSNQILNASQQPNAWPYLRAGESLTRQIKGGEAQSFTIIIAAGQYAEIYIEQHGSILLATLFDPQGKKVIQMDFPGGGYGPIKLSVIAALSGDYRLEVSSINKWANSANYDVALVELRGAEANDQSMVQNQMAFAEARNSFNADHAATAIEGYNRTLAYWQASQNRHWEAVTQYALSQAYRSVGDRQQTEECLNKALQILKLEMTPNDWRLKASSLNDLGAIYAALGKNEQSLSVLTEALDLYAANNDKRGQASALNNIAIAHGRQGELSLALELVKKALAFRNDENDKPGAISLLNSLGAICDRLGEPDRALDYFEQALRDWQSLEQIEASDRPRLATLLNNLALECDKLGKWNQALEYYDKALDNYKDSDPRRAATLDNKGELYASLGNLTQARECYEKALKDLASGKPDLDVKAGLMVHMGQLSSAEGDLKAALVQFEQARSIQPNPPKLADVLTNLGVALALRGDLEKAMEAYQSAYDIQLKLTDKRGQALTLQKRGEARAFRGEKDQAVEDLNRALGLWKAVKDPRGEAATLSALARVEQARGNLVAALAKSDEAIKIIESLRTNISARQLRTSYFATRESYYEFDVDLNMQYSQHEKTGENVAAALESNEKSRARVLLDSLGEAAVGQAETGESPDTQLAIMTKQRHALSKKLAAKARARTTLLNGAHSATQLASLDKDIDDLSTQYDELEGRIRSHNPRFNSLIKPKPSSLNQIQNQLETDTMLLEYSLGDRHSYVWAVTSDSIDGFQLPPRADMESPAKRITKSLADRKRSVEGETEAQWERRRAQADEEFNTASAELSDKIIRPLAPLLGTKRLVVVADGALQLVSFAALPLPGITAEKPRRLIDDHEIVYEPSASVLALQRSELANRKRAPHAVAILANPVFGSDDSRVTALNGNPSSKAQPKSNGNGSPEIATRRGDVSRALEDIGLERFPRLRSSEAEAQKIGSLAPKGESKVALDFDASRETAMSKELSEYRIVHFATHAVVNYEHPELSGIVLSLVDRRGQPQDGYLRLHDIYNLNLPADLIVLSACQTGVGKAIKGEGLIALTRGFMYAGAERVVASLWKVDDAATAELMAQFYKQMFVNGQRPAAALRAAQITLAKKRSPADWAGFVLQGEWK